MPTIASSQFPIPKSWDEFEDIVWDLYKRIWDDPNAQRYGRAGQRQHGVDIYGQPHDLGGRYVGIQCKRYDAGKLTKAVVNREIAKVEGDEEVEGFGTPLVEFIIATTDPRAKALQDFLRQLNAERKKRNVFAVRIVFWDDLWSTLSHPDNRDLLRKHYPELALESEPPSRATRIPALAPDLPEHYVFRAKPFTRIKKRLLAEPHAETSILAISAIQGLGGIGKTVLAAALAHDPEVRARYPDGILWATLGQTHESITELHTWIQELGAYDLNPTTVDAATAHLRTLLTGKACLLVVDDAWDPEHVRPFQLGAPNSQLLITTRDAGLARRLHARLFDLDVMTEAQSLALLESRLGLKDADRESAVQLARILGHLPLALELAAAQIQGGYYSWSELFGTYEDRLAAVGILDYDDPRRPNESLRLSFDLSLGQLTAEDRTAFAWLGITAEDAVLNPAMAAVLWDQPEPAARRRLLSFRDRSLVRQVADHRYRLHDLLHDEAAHRLASILPLSKAHAQLLDRYRTLTNDGLWHTLSDDAYIHQNLAWHMQQAGMEDQIHALLCEETSEGRNAWFDARERLAQTAGYIADVRDAWQLAEVRNKAGLQCRYALIWATLRSMTASVPPDLLAALVQTQFWPVSQGLAYALQTPGDSRLAAALGVLAPHLSTEQMAAALKACLGIKWPYDRAEALVTLVPHLSGTCREGTLAEAVASAREIRDEGSRAKISAILAPHSTGALRERITAQFLAAAHHQWSEGTRADLLVGISPHLTEEQLGEALAIALDLKQEGIRAAALSGLAPQLGEELMGEGLSAAIQISEEKWRSGALAGLGPHLMTRYTEDGVAAARAMSSEKPRAMALIGLAGSVSGELREQLLDEALLAARAIEPDFSRASVLLSIGKLLCGDRRQMVLAEAFEAAQTIASSSGRASELADQVEHVTGKLRDIVLTEALLAACAISDELRRAQALIRLSPHLTAKGRDRALSNALASAQKVERVRWRAEVLADLAPHLAWEQRRPALGEALAAGRLIEDEPTRAATLAALGPYLADGQVDEALSAARALLKRRWRARALVALASRLTGNDRRKVFGEALAAVLADGDYRYTPGALAGLSRHLTVDQMEQAIEGALSIWYEPSCATALAGLAPDMTPDQIARAVATARSLSLPESRATVLSALAPQLEGDQQIRVLREADAAARAIDYAQSRAKALTDLLLQLTGEPRHQLLTEAQSAAQEIPYVRERVEALVRLSSLLEGERRECVPSVALSAAQGISLEERRAEALAGLGPNLSAPLTAEALEAAWALPSDWYRAQALIGLAAYLTEDQVCQVLVMAARAIDDSLSRAKALGRLAPYLEALQPSFLRPLWYDALRILTLRTRRSLLRDIAALSPVIHTLGGPEAIAETFRAIQDVGRWWP